MPRLKSKKRHSEYCDHLKDATQHSPVNSYLSKPLKWVHVKTDLNRTHNEGSSGASEITALQKRGMKKTKFKREKGSRVPE